jgi:hypothetical protein
VFGLFLTFWIPTAAVIKAQLSVLLMLWLFWQVERRLLPADSNVNGR